MKTYQKPQVDVYCEELIEDTLLSSGIQVKDSVLGFEGDETW